jgi:hypothetical protein
MAPRDIPRRDNLIDVIKDLRVPKTETEDGWVQVGTGLEISPPFQNSWGNASGGTPAAFWIDKHGVVRLRGDLEGGTVGTTAFTLPVGFRPETSEAFVTSGVDFGTGMGVSKIRVDPNGNVVILSNKVIL